jgi:phospholipid/cholesterol/gamma-HCH transport system permease protein
MTITDQVHAMKMLGLDFMRHLVVPMVLAVTVSTFVLTCVFDVVGIGGGYLIGTLELGIPLHTYHALTLDALRLPDVVTGLAKPWFFGAIAGTLGCHYGLSVRGGGKGLGQAVTKAVVAASFTVLVADFFLTKALKALVP